MTEVGWLTAMSHETHGQCFCCDSHCNGDAACSGGCGWVGPGVTATQPQSGDGR